MRRQIVAVGTAATVAVPGLGSSGSSTRNTRGRTASLRRWSPRPMAPYPLTMVIYAAAPTSGVSHAKAAAIAKFIDYAAGAGQSPGLLPGQLPPGFLPLTAKLRAQARKAAQEVRNQTGASKA